MRELPMTWKRDTRPENVRKVGPFTVWSETNTDRETCHVIGFPDGREMRVLPSGQSGRLRATVVREGCQYASALPESLVADLGPLVVIGWLSGVPLDWQWVDEPDICEACGRPL